MTRKVAIFLLGFGWVLGATIASIPMFWNNWLTAKSCEFDEVLPPWYMAGIITPGFSMIWICMLIVYWRIWREASKHVKHLRSSANGIHEIPSDWKSVQVSFHINTLWYALYYPKKERKFSVHYPCDLVLCVFFVRKMTGNSCRWTGWSFPRFKRHCG